MRPDPRPRGVLGEAAARGHYHARRVLPSDALTTHVAYFWLVRWALEQPFEQQVLTHPACHFVFEQNDVTGRMASRAVGPRRLRFTRTLTGAGHILGVALHAGTARAWLGHDVATLTDSAVPLRTKVVCDARAVERSILQERQDGAAVRAAEAFLRPLLPALDDEARLAASLVERITADRELTRVEHLVQLTGRSERALQRLFQRHVGLSPKAVLRRFRLAEAAETLATHPAQRLTDLAHALGYFDQAHFCRDFRAVLGRSVSEYRRD